MSVAPAKEDLWLKTYCQGCWSATCGLRVHRVDGVVVGLEGDPDNPFNAGKLCAKAYSNIMALYDPYRPSRPLVRTNPDKGIGVDPHWKEVSWEEALDLAARRLAEIRQSNPMDLLVSFNDSTRVLWMPGPFAIAFGTANININDPTCADAVHCQPYHNMAAFHANPDYEYCEYLVLWGSNKGGLVQHLGTTVALDIAEFRSQGRLKKLVCIDPVQSNIAAKADEWVPILPGTDLALALAWLNVLLNEAGIYDVEFLKQYTNGPYLLKPDGHYLRDSSTSKPLMWDPVEARAKPFDAQFQDVALEGYHEVDGISCKTAFQHLKEHVAPYTPEWAAPITTLGASTIRRLAREFGEAASIGSTISFEGHILPHRPASIHWYSGISQHTNGYMTGIALITICLVVGAVQVPGGLLGESTIVDYPYLPPEKRTLWSGKGAVPGISEDGLLVPSMFARHGGHMQTGYPPLKPSHTGRGTGIEFFPVGFTGKSIWILNHLDPQRFNNKIPRFKAVMGLHCNDLTNNMNPQEMAQITKDQFRIACEPLVDETAEFADIFFPAPTRLERLQMGSAIAAYMGGTIGLRDNCINYSQPVVDEVKGMDRVDVCIELAARAGFLPELNQMVNIMWDLPEEYRLEPNRKYSYAEMLERFIKGVYGQDPETLAQVGHVKWRKSVPERYPRLFMQGRAFVYYEHFLTAREELAQFTREAGIEWDVSEYEPFPSWHPAASLTDTKSGFDLIAVPYRLPVLTHTWQTHNAWMVELAEHHPWGMDVVMNAATGARLGLRDGDPVVVESVAGFQQEAKVKLTQCVHPQVVGLSAHGGHWCSHPVAQGKGTQIHFLIPHSLKYMDKLLGGIETCIRVKVSKAANKARRWRLFR